MFDTSLLLFVCQESDFRLHVLKDYFHISVLNSKVSKLPYQFLYQKINFDVVFIISRIILKKKAKSNPFPVVYDKLLKKNDKKETFYLGKQNMIGWMNRFSYFIY